MVKNNNNLLLLKKIKKDKKEKEQEISDKNGSSSSNDEWESIMDPLDKWRDQLQRLATLGFTESETYISMLEEENGDLEKVVNRIIRRNA